MLSDTKRRIKKENTFLVNGALNTRNNQLKNQVNYRVMNLAEYNYQNITDVDMAFSTINMDEKLLKESKERGFYHGDKIGNKMFNKLFFSGCKLKFKDNLPVNLENNAWKYCVALMKSFSPKHEAKESVCSMLMEEILHEETLKL